MSILLANPEKLTEIADGNQAVNSYEEDNSDDEKWTRYLIKKGSNYNSGVNFAPLTHDTIQAYIRFDSSAIHQTQLPVNQWDWSKLIGFSDCGSLHQLNSIRLVWRWNPQLSVVELGQYIYRSGVVSYEKIDQVQVGEVFSCMIYVTSNTYNITLKGVNHSSPRPCSYRGTRYWLLPYYGGNEPAPQDIVIYLSHIFPRLSL